MISNYIFCNTASYYILLIFLFFSARQKEYLHQFEDGLYVCDTVIMEM